MLRLGMIGCGQISERFFRQAAARNDCRFVATCARTLASAERKAREHGVEGWFDSYEQMLDEARPDAVVVTTPHSLHAAPAIAALRRGIHVLNEKPMATSLADCRAMVDAASGSGATLMCLPYDASPAFRTAAAYLNEEWLGKFTGAESVLLIPGPPRDNWYYDRSIAHGGAMLDCLVYPMSRLVSFLGPAARVMAMANTLIPHRLVGDGKRMDSDVDDNVTLVVEWAGGQQAVVRTLWGTSFVRNDTTIYGRRGTLWLAGANVLLHSPDRPVPGGEPVEWQGFSNCYRIPVSDAVPNESIVDHFVASLNSGRQPTCNGAMQLHTHEALFKAYEAAESGRALPLETRFEPWNPLPAAFFDTRSAYV